VDFALGTVLARKSSTAMSFFGPHYISGVDAVFVLSTFSRTCHTAMRFYINKNISRRPHWPRTRTVPVLIDARTQCKSNRNETSVFSNRYQSYHTCCCAYTKQEFVFCIAHFAIQLNSIPTTVTTSHHIIDSTMPN